MKVSTLIALAAGIVIPLQVATFGYVLTVEHRLTRIETTLQLLAPRPASVPAPPAVSS